jgi:3'-phosphoadenosine 5'-phosphosulfate sulfotransferase (PAPS reductase)/FAD synthetase
MFTDYETMLINKTILTIKKYLEIHDNTALSFSGGKDSTVLLYIIRNMMGLNIPCVFCNTGVEFNSIIDFVKTFKDITWVKPIMSFTQVIKKYGYPVISKEQSQYIYDIRNPNCCEKTKNIRLAKKGNFRLSNKWRFLLDTNIKISSYCCYHLKKAPLKKLKFKYITGERIVESNLRKQRYHTCILPNKCVPLRLWSDELIDKFIRKNNINICDIYKYERSTGCKFCLYGIHLEKNPDRIDRLKIIEPASYTFAKKIGLVRVRNIVKGGAINGMV